MTAAKLQNLLTGLPVKILAKIQRLSKETGESVASIVKQAIDLYERRAKARLNISGDDELARIMKDPAKRAVFEEITTAMRERGRASITPEKKQLRASEGGKGRAEALTKERRSKIARDAVNARWEKKRLADGASAPEPVE